MNSIKKITATTLKAMSHAELITLFKTLGAPTLTEMQGEYRATLLKQPNVFATLSGLIINNPFLDWQTKAFRPVDDAYGRGYNTFIQKNKIIQKFPMQTTITTSKYDSKPIYQLFYKRYKSFCGDINMVDEVRKVDENLYLGIGTWGFWKKQRMIAYPFMLEGPIHQYRKDIGTVR